MNNIGYISKAITFADTTAVNVGLLPPNAYVVRAYPVVTTAFNDSGAQIVDVGITGNADAVLDGVSVATAGVIAGTVQAAALGVLSTTEQTQVTATFIGTSTAGAAIITVEYAFSE